MKENQLLDLLGNIDPAYIEKASAPGAKRLNPMRRFCALAACLVLLLSVGIGSYAYAAEAKEYNDAIRFFNDNDLSTEGLTRREIKQVYRDITTESFTYTKTAQVLASSLNTYPVGGVEIEQESPTPEAVESLWNYKNYYDRFLTNAQTGIHYRYRTEYSGENQIDFDRSCFEKYDGDTFLWSVSVSAFEIFGYIPVSDGVIVHGETDTTSSRQKSWAYLAKFSEDGTLLWQTKLDNGFHGEYVAAVLENPDGGYAVFSRGDWRYFCLSQYTSDGKVAHIQKTEVGNYGIWNAAHFDGGYIVQLGSHVTAEYAKIVKVDYEGNITEAFSYSAEDSYYFITDMMEYNGNIYLSAYAVPSLDDESQNAGGRYEIANVLNELFDREAWNISDEELTPMVRENYTAVLLVCDRTGGAPLEFYSVKGSLGGELSLGSEGQLLWDVQSITTTFFSLMTSSFTIGGTCHVFQYTFDEFGTLVSQQKTGEVTSYRR